ncbi:unnamed protein product [Lampetra fluviatilis]
MVQHFRTAVSFGQDDNGERRDNGRQMWSDAGGEVGERRECVLRVLNTPRRKIIALLNLAALLLTGGWERHVAWDP